MAGNVRANATISTARSRGRSADDVYRDVAETFDGLSRFDRAWAMGYLARLVDRPLSRNPYEPDDEVSARCRERWEKGWQAAGSGDFSDLEKRVREFRRK